MGHADDVIAGVLPVYLVQLIFQNEHITTKRLVSVLYFNQVIQFIDGQHQEADLIYATELEHWVVLCQAGPVVDD